MSWFSWFGRSKNIEPTIIDSSEPNFPIVDDFVHIDQISPKRSNNLCIDGSIVVSNVQQQKSKCDEKVILSSGAFFYTSNWEQMRIIQQHEKFLENFDENLQNYPSKFKEMMRCGIPDSNIRKIVWTKLTGAENLKLKNPNLYQKLAQSPKTEHDDKIAKDVHRTYPQYELFSKKDGPGQKALFRILKAYSFFDKEVGYCQGMAFIAGFLLMHMEEEDAFWMLFQIFNNPKYGLKDLYRPGLPKLQLIMFTLDNLLKQILPNLHKHLTEQGVNPEMYASGFLLTLCCNRFSFELCERIWDIFLNEGWKMIIRAIIGLMKLCKDDLMKMGTAEIVPYLHKVAITINCQTLLNSAFSITIHKKTLQHLQEEFNIKAKEEYLRMKKVDFCK